MPKAGRTAAFEDKVKARFGMMPAFFRANSAAPELIEQLWAFAEASYLDTPLPSLFKERLFVYLSRFCEVRYCIVRHVGFLIGAGRPAGDASAPPHSVEAVIRLLRRPVATPEILMASLARLDAGGRLAGWPEPATQIEDDLFTCLTALFLTPARCEPVKAALRRAVGERDFEFLIGFLAFIRAAHFWTLMHPEIQIEADMVALMQAHEALSQLLLEDPEAGRCDLNQRMVDELFALRELHERQELVKAKQQLEEKDQQKDRFIAVLAHELRNPLAAIHAAAATLGLMPMRDAGIERIRERVERQTTAMARMLDDLLDASRIPLGKVTIVRQEIDLAALLRDVLRDAEERVAAAGQQVELEIPDMAIRVAGDRVRITQIIDNVLSNAIKFTQAGGQIAVRLRTREARAVISITDSGVGFDREFERAMFAPFVQATQSFERPASGLGLGLAIGRQLAELHGGTLSATSPGPGKGSEFVIQLPLSAGPDGARPAGEAATAAPGLRILLVEDNRDVAASLKEMIEWVGHRVEIARDGTSALDKARAGELDLILCDLGLPGKMSGFDVARACRQDALLKQLRVIAVSGHGGFKAQQVARAAGFDELLVKPLSLSTLRQITSR
jgi:signal transduction histidine kinase/CheY-like chemotaxis protein